ncbi:MAG: DUF6602 domain-containing protein [Nostoc sp.]|uniref:DUF6602 domain-containing protein n=1 Tax=unclassified Nostoc TaxID=2593658 RepID=UPI001DD73122|nr:DUF6602 domain-containing protein [Nostoc sp. JL34]MBN3883828.1 hypothetical protein [Nostoc sp. JL34]
MAEFHVSQLLKSVAEQMRIVLQQKLISHPGELGTGREEVIRDFLRKHLPKRFGVSTGFVFDAHGKVSRQIDIVIYDASLCPSFEAVGGKMFFPCESVVAVGEVKSQLTSTKIVAEAYDNIRSVKELDRSAGDKNLSIIDGHPIAQRYNHLDQIFTFLIVTDQCVSSKSMRETLFYYNRDYPRYQWVNLCYYFDQYLITYCCENGVCPNPMDAYAIGSLENQSPELLLLKFYKLLARAIEVINVSKFAYWEYLNGSESWEAFSYPFDSMMPYDVWVPPHMSYRPGEPEYQETDPCAPTSDSTNAT